jgi:hypothetical protein
VIDRFSGQMFFDSDIEILGDGLLPYFEIEISTVIVAVSFLGKVVFRCGVLGWMLPYYTILDDFIDDSGDSCFSC